MFSTSFVPRELANLQMQNFRTVILQGEKKEELHRMDELVDSMNFNHSSESQKTTSFNAQIMFNR
jgi:hypothetical protein